MKWSKTYELGIKEIDEQHKSLIQMLDNIYIACSRGEGTKYIEEAIRFLEGYVEKHFRDEEAIQALYNYPRIKEHQAIHKRYLEELNKLILEIKGKKVETQHIAKVVAYLNNMIRYHIKGEDKVLADYIKYQKIKVKKRHYVSYDEDKITGFYTLESFKKKMEINIKKKWSHVVFAIIQVDGFSQVKRTYGYDIGDEVLIYLSGIFRAYEKEHLIITHTYENEFMICFNESYEGEAIQTLEAIRENVYAGFHKEDSIIPLTLSIGISTKDEYTKTIKNLMQHASIAVDVAKQRGRNQIVHFTKEMHEDIKQKVELIRMLQPHQLHNYFRVVYQPIYDGKTLKIQGAEALLRLVDDEGKSIPPSVFIPFAEENQLIYGLGNFCVKEVSKCLYTIDQLGLAIDHISINVSLKQVMDNQALESLLQHAQTYPIDLSKIFVELTESTLIEDRQKVNRFIDAIKSRGSKVLLDDFGSGFSALAYLSQVDMDVIKLDKSLVDHILTNKKAYTILKDTIKLIDQIGLSTVVEGIETKEQLEVVQKFGVGSIQGYYLSRPIEESQLIELLKRKE